ncbi:hypothetical protein Hdeb2414_s0157g00817091 [Helianthus debilis subsp. tardiflorus]
MRLPLKQKVQHQLSQPNYLRLRTWRDSFFLWSCRYYVFVEVWPMNSESIVWCT